jgi:anti-sigma factor RsiW
MADLSALADGTIAPDRRAHAEELVASSPELRERFERERQLVARLHAARAGDRAPASLRARLETDRERRAAVPRRPAFRLAGAAGAIAVALVVVLGITLSPGSTPTLAGTVALATRSASQPVSAVAHSGTLTAHVGWVRFPSRIAALDVAATGERADRIDGRQAITVYYAGRGGSIAYSVLASALPRPSGSAVVVATGYYLLTVGHRTVFTWRSGADTCVISATGPSGQLLAGSARRLATSLD